MSENDDVIKEFLIESHENLDRIDQDLLRLENNPGSKDILAQIFRAVHTIKGTCSFFGFPKLQSLTHAAENLLSRLREGQLPFSREIATALMKMGDAVREIIAQIETTGQEGKGEYSGLIEVLTSLQKASPVNEETAPALSKNDKPSDPAGENGLRGNINDSHIRVDVDLLDRLMTLVGELVLARNQVLQFKPTQENQSFTAATQRLNIITSELQESVMKTRMQPIGKVWNKLPRLVRDLAMASGKKIRVEMEGEGTELDKTLVEAVSEPLVHLVRNAIDHGIELPQNRVAKGKSAEGLLALRASHESGHVIIQISDDGAGINIEKVKEKAIKNALISEEQAPRLTERDAINLIFLPGLSTAEKVTNLSGRGVGMDVVKTNIEKIGGTIEVQNRGDQGTAFKIKIPLTLAIMPALVIGCGDEHYAIPQVNLLELLRLENAQAHGGIEKIHGVPVYRLRGRLLPLVYLRRELGETIEDEKLEEISRNIVVLQAGNHPFGLVVDSVYNTEEIVVKPLGWQIKNVPLFAGATIMGDGRVALILDVLGVALHAHVLSEAGERIMSDKDVETAKPKESRQTLLLFKSPDNGRMAIPLSMVTRLEKFPTLQVERVGEREVFQYRGQILPLVPLSKILPERRKSPRAAETVAPVERKDALQVVVYTHQGKNVGLVVDHIIDIVEEKLDMQSAGARRGVLGSSVILGRVTELLDLEILVRSAGSYINGKSGREETAHD